MRRRYVLSLLCALTGSAALALSPSWPEPNAETRPWTRWWWLGNIVDETSLTHSMERYREAGLGGVEITPIYGVRGQEKRFIPYLSKEWVKHFSHVLREGQRLDLGIDLATGTGWPFGGPWIGEDGAARHLKVKQWVVHAGCSLGEPISLEETPTLRFAGPTRRKMEELRQPVSANENLQELALDQVRFPGPLKLVRLSAYSPNGQCLNLTPLVSSAGQLQWRAPLEEKGDWRLVGLFQGLHGKQVERAAPGGEGNVIDHFSSEALATYLRAFDTAFKDEPLEGLRAFFNDSYEVDDAHGQADYTPALLEEFVKRRGYDLGEHLDALLPGAEGERVDRVLCDLRETLSELLLEKFTRGWQAWAAKQGKIIRNQAHGSPANLLDLYLASDIPEQEGRDRIAFKLPASTAHFKGTKLVSSEAGTWLDEHWQGSLAQLKTEVDRFFLGGINHNCYHGTALSPEGETWPGFQFYASVELNPANPQWPHFSSLNSYVTRVQSLLQAGQSDEQLLLYYNIHDRWSQRGSGTLPHFHGKEGEGMESFRLTAGELLDAGYGWDAVSDSMILSLRVRNGVLRSPGGTEYAALILPDLKYIPVATLAHIESLVQAGATLILAGKTPDDVPGLGDLELRRAKVREIATRLFNPTRTQRGEGRVLSNAGLPVLVAQAGLKPEVLPSKGLSYIRRKSPEGALYFVNNPSGAAFEGWLPLAGRMQAPALFDPLSGRIASLTHRSNSKGGSEVLLHLNPGESLLVVSTNGMAPDQPAFWVAAAAPQSLNSTNWSLSFHTGGPSLPAPHLLSAIQAWTELEDPHLRDFSGTGRYSTKFPRPTGNAPFWRLALGELADSARILLNGKELATLMAPPFHVDIPEAALLESNLLEIEIANTGANRIAALDRANPSWKRFYNVNMAAHLRENRDAQGLFSAAGWKTRKAGLTGPVTLTPLKPLSAPDPTPAK